MAGKATVATWWKVLAAYCQIQDRIGCQLVIAIFGIDF